MLNKLMKRPGTVLTIAVFLFAIAVLPAVKVAPLVMSGRIKYREDIVDGLDLAPSAFIGLLEGRNFGKLMVRVSVDPTRP